MKRLIIFVSALILVSFQVYGVPAKRGWVNYTQPDGSVVKIKLAGDEFHHWAIDEYGNYLSANADGFLRIATRESSTQAREQSVRRMKAERLRATFRAQGNDMTSGTRRIPVVLIAFSDLDFKISDPKNAFDRLLNLDGYSDNGGTGSVNQYYRDNSGGLFNPVFDVYGPVKLSNKYSYYGENDSMGEDKRPDVALYEACCLLDSTIDFSQYDYDNDGLVDMVLYYYAGYNEAEGASSKTIWPHQYSLLLSSNYNVRNNSFDGKQVASYFCTSELQGTSGTIMCGIGTTCHEFAHSLGLPDFYDTDYEDNGGETLAMCGFSVMDSGSYVNEGRTPPYFTSEEKIILEWMDEESIVTVKRSGSLSLGPMNEGNALKTETTTEGEYFVYEYRSGTGWDAYIPEGLLVTHIDKSNRKVGYDCTAAELWYYWESTNSINAFGAHPCCYVIPSSKQNVFLYNDFSGYMEEIVFPGYHKVNTYNPVDWNKEKSPITFSELAASNGVMTGIITSTEDPGDDPGDEPNPGDDPDPAPSLAMMGFISIDDPGRGEYSSQEPFKLKLLIPSETKTTRIEWFVDDARVQYGTDEINLTAGVHNIMALVFHEGGNPIEYIELRVNVN